MLTMTPRATPSIGDRKADVLTMTPRATPSIGDRLGKQTC